MTAGLTSVLSRALLVISCALALGGCRKSESTSTAPSLKKTKTMTQFNIQSLQMPNLVSVDWDFTFWFLDETPPSQYNEVTPSSTGQNGAISSIYPCLTGPSGTGNNQVQATATLHFADQTSIVGKGSALFVCNESGDTPVNIVISIVIPVNAGDVDNDGQVTVVTCNNTNVQWKDDSWLAVCSDSTCGDADAVFLFHDECSQIGGGTPTYWTCGASADWTILNIPTPTPPTASATSQFAVPPIDGTWQFGLSALPTVVLAQPDPTLTDAAGDLEVYSNISTPIATLTRTNGINSASLDATRTAAFAVDLILAADTAGGATPQQLLEIRTDSSGTSASVWEPFGACDGAVQGTQSWPGLYPIDARLAAPGTATIVFSTTPNGVATSSALCTAVRANDGTPQINCAAAGPLS